MLVPEYFPDLLYVSFEGKQFVKNENHQEHKDKSENPQEKGGFSDYSIGK
jgi:hypothetical protein